MIVYLVFVSQLLYSSADFYVDQQSALLNQPLNLIMLPPLRNRLILEWIFVILAILSIFSFYVLKKSQFMFEIVQAIGLPLTTFWCFHDLKQFHNIENLDEYIISIEIIPYILINILVVLKIAKFHFFYDDPELNEVIRIQNITKLLQICKITLCSLLLMINNADLVIYFLLISHLIITVHKIININYFDPANQLCLLLTDAWGWISLVCLILRSNGYQTIWFYVLIPIILLLIMYPPQLLMHFLDCKIIWNINRYYKNNQSVYSQMLIIYYATHTFKKVNDNIWLKVSEDFTLFIYNQIKQILGENLNNFNALKSYKNFIGQNFTIANKLTKLKQLSQSDRMILIYEYIAKKKLFLKNKAKYYHFNIFLYDLLIGMNWIRFESIYQYYYIFLSGDYQFAKKQTQVNIQMSYQKLKKQKFKQNKTNSIFLEISKYNKINQLIQSYIKNEKFYITERKKLKINLKLFRKFMNTKSILKKQIEDEIKFLNIISPNNLHSVVLEFMVQKYVHNNPTRALHQYSERIQSTQHQKNQISQIKNIGNSDIFICVLGQDYKIKYLNKSFCEKMKIKKRQSSLILNDIIPQDLRQDHKTRINDNQSNISEIYKHNSNPYYFLAQSQSATIIYETSMSLKLFPQIQAEMLVVGMCKIQEQEKRSIYLQHKFENNLIQTNLEPYYSQIEKKTIMDTTYKIVKTVQKRNYLTEKLFEVNSSKNHTINNTQAIFNLAQQLTSKEQIIEQKKLQINPLESVLNRTWIKILVSIFILLVIVIVVGENMYEYSRIITSMNNIYNSYYIVIISIEFFTPSIYLMNQINNIETTSAEAAIFRQSMLQEIQIINIKVIQYRNKISKNIYDKQLVEAIFLPFQVQNQILYLYKQFQIMVIEFQSFAFSLRSQSEWKQEDFLQQSEIFVQKFIYQQDQDNIFKCTSVIFFKISNELRSRQNILFIVGIFTIVSALLFVLYQYMVLRNNLEELFRKIIIQNQTAIAFERELDDFTELFQDFTMNRSISIFSSDFRKKKLPNKMENNFSEFSGQKNIYSYQFFLCLFTILSIGLITSFLVNTNHFNSKQLTEIDVKLQASYQFLEFNARFFHFFSHQQFEVLGNSGSQRFYHSDEEKFDIEIQYQLNVNFNKIFKNIFQNEDTINKIQQDPCKYWIDCSNLSKQDKPINLYASKNKLINFNIQIQILAEDDTFDAKKLKHIFTKAFQLISSMNHICNEIWKQDRNLREIQGQIIRTKIIVTYLIAFSTFITLIIQFIRMNCLYNRYRKQIFSHLPSNKMLSDENFIRETNQLLNDRIL